MTLDEVNGRNPGALRQSEVVDQYRIAHAHLVERVAPNGRELQAGVRSVNFDQGSGHRFSRAACCSRYRQLPEILEGGRHLVFAPAGFPVDLKNGRCYMRFTRYTKKSWKYVFTHKKHIKLIKLEKIFPVSGQSRPLSQPLNRLGSRARLKRFDFDPMNSGRLLCVKYSVQFNVLDGVTFKSTGAK